MVYTNRVIIIIMCRVDKRNEHGSSSLTTIRVMDQEEEGQKEEEELFTCSSKRFKNYLCCSLFLLHSVSNALISSDIRNGLHELPLRLKYSLN